MLPTQYQRQECRPHLRVMPFVTALFGALCLYMATVRVAAICFGWHLPGYGEPVSWRLEVMLVGGSVAVGAFFMWSALELKEYWNEYELSPQELTLVNRLTHRKVTIPTRDMVVTTVRRRYADCNLHNPFGITGQRRPLLVRSMRDGRVVYITNHLPAFEDFREDLVRFVQHEQSSE